MSHIDKDNSIKRLGIIGLSIMAKEIDFYYRGFGYAPALNKIKHITNNSSGRIKTHFKAK